jgi:cytochrome c oxidase cbb3-type subunit 2
MFHFMERNPFFFAVFLFIVIAYAGLIEILPSFNHGSRPIIDKKPYTMLEIAGRQVYIQENCMSCHSQLVRPFKSETDRYGMYSLSGEYVYDRPFLWGSKRTGPDLHRVGNYRTTDWHENHMMDPAAIVPSSIMPPYPWLFSKTADLDTAYAEAVTVKTVFNTPYDQAGMPSTGGSVDEARKIMLAQAKEIVDDMKNPEVKAAFEAGEVKQIVAVIAYLNSLK